MENNKPGENKKALFSSYLQNINLKEIFADKELDRILSDFDEIDNNIIMNSPKISAQKSISNNNDWKNDTKKKYSFTNSKKVNEILCDRTKFILNILKLSSDKLKKDKLNYLAKGVEW